MSVVVLISSSVSDMQWDAITEHKNNRPILTSLTAIFVKNT